jgi:pyridoxamine 5'-phosphate oxidase
VVIGVDAPLVIPNASGMRDADKLAHSHFGKYHAGAYPASRAREYWKLTTGLSKALLRRGFPHGDHMRARANGRYQIEVHPHAAMVQLNRLQRIIKYKRGTLAERRAGLNQLRTILLERFPLLTPRLVLVDLPEIPERGAEVKALEDRLDAIVCAYIAAHWWYWGRARNDVLGDSKRGYIVVPKRETLAELRENYLQAGLLESDLDPNPFAQFDRWFAQAREAGMKEPNAMALATADQNGRPSARIVLLKGLDQNGFVFYTNYESRKGRELAANPHAALVFYWPELERQVCISGEVTRVAEDESEHYFHSRPEGSQIGAWASRQSQTIANREVIESHVAQLRAEFAGQPIPRPAYWGGFRLRPEAIEFWQGRPNRLHDRLRYTRAGDGPWRIERLSP